GWRGYPCSRMLQWGRCSPHSFLVLQFIQSRFEGAYSIGHAVEMAQVCKVFPPFIMRHRRYRAGVGALSLQALADEGAGRDVYIVGDGEVPDDVGGTTDGAAAAYACAARNRDAAGNRGMRTDAYVVGNLNL